MKNIKKMLALSALIVALPVSVLQRGILFNKSQISTAFAQSQEETKEVSLQTVAENKENPLNLSAKSAFVFEPTTQTVVYSYNEEERLPIASMCKIMTLLLCFDEIKQGNLTFEEEVSVSENASSMGGSQVFLEANAKYPVKELIKSIAVCSANDSCVAMAERISGSESVFTDRMNEKAKELGAENTLFANCTGLPKEPQYSCAKDVAFMLKALLNHKEYYEFGQVWMDKFQHPKGRYTEISNTNKLVRFYDGCDGGKTGFTNQAGFCLAATAKRNDMRVISVVIGEKDSKTRFNDVRATFDYTFANYVAKTVIDDKNPIEEKAYVSGGKQKEIAVRPERESKIFSKRGVEAGYSTQTYIKKNLKAPLSYGDNVGEILVFKDGVEIDRIPLIANESVEKATLFDRFKDVAEGWFIK
ncbi:MAG: D-alanyl-D-alanine carboxypeptidase [Clostridiales bacterium]|nr:D-alanyl-D-alanine carboxypeptidase [Clostridiales bacterium]